MRVLGISEEHDSHSCIIENGRVLAAAGEERFSRIKNHDSKLHGLNRRSLEFVLDYTGSNSENIDMVALAILPPWKLQMRVLQDMAHQKNWKWSLFFMGSWSWAGPLWYGAPYVYNTWRLKRMRKLLRAHNLHKTPISLVGHHLAHAASAYYTSADDDALVITMDGKGDGLAGSVYKGTGGDLELVNNMSKYNSLGYLYSAVTEGYGFKHNRHEGKITGLAAYGDQNSPAYQSFKGFIEADGLGVNYKLNREVFQPPFPHWRNHKYMWRQIVKRIPESSREDVAAAVQRRTEDVVTGLVANAVDKTGLTKINLAGGIFANVRVNQKILQLKDVESIYIHPCMGDGGMAVGAALYAWSRHMLDAGKKIKTGFPDNVYYGPEFTEAEIEKSLKEEGVKYEYHKKVEPEIAGLISDGHVIARFNGRVEYGPRALGNRSILYQPTDNSVNDWLNKRLQRTEFMPFAPVSLEEDLKGYYLETEGGEMPARFMTVTFDCTEDMKKECPAVVHVDGTARPQTICKSQNESYYEIVKEYKKLTGLRSMINTSYNMHEEPIVCTPYDAIRAFKMGHLDYLAIGNFIAKNDIAKNGIAKNANP